MGMNTEEKSKLYQTFFNLLKSYDEDNSEDDKTFRKNTKDQITKRDKEYSCLLAHFVKITRVRNIVKEIFKWVFCLALIVSMIMCVIIVYRLFNKYISSADIKEIVEAAPLLISAIVGLVSAIIAIPITITKYLFSTEEDKNITEIILHTQKHDTSGRNWAMEFKKMIEKLEDEKRNSNEKDENRKFNGQNKTDVL